MENYEFDIAVGKHRKETSWRNVKISWASFLDRLRETHRTHESYAEYIKAKPARQAVIKDVGGFVGGYLIGGKRKKNTVLHRQIVTLDLDFANVDFWEDYVMLNDNAAALYSTHKHSSATPRYRLIIPLDREVNREEYEAISRRIAGDLGIELFDPSTFQPERLMYYPSTSKNGEYVFCEQGGEPVCADAILSKYVDWKDASAWPVSERVGVLVRSELTKQGDPTEKPGQIGAFCRTYNIHEAIEKFLPDVYEGAGDGRYTYLAGSTSGGVVIYDDLYAYSHHGSDPAGEKLCNAFDLIRLHKFADLDINASSKTNISKLPSFVAMQEFVGADGETRKTIGIERIQSAKIDFADFVDVGEDADEVLSLDWLGEMDTDKKGNYTSSAKNLGLIFKHDPAFRGAFIYDSFENRDLVVKNLPWRKINGREYTKDSDDAGIRVHIENVYGITGKDKIFDAFVLSVMENSVHPVKEYLEKCEWDGVSRLDNLLVNFMGAEDSEYTRNVTRKAFVAAIARIMRPGCMFQYILTLVGGEGKQKSTIFRKMAGAWFSDSFAGVHGKEAVEQLQGVWVIEIGELAGIKKAEVEAVKHYVAKQVDRGRPAYGRRIENFPRQCIFVATTNEHEFLQGVNGNRRFWPVTIWETAPTLDVSEDLTDEYIAQVWGEAKALYERGERVYLLAHEEQAAREKQMLHTETDDRVDIIRAYLDILLPAEWDALPPVSRRAYLLDVEEIKANGVVRRERVTVPEIWAEALGGAAKDLNTFASKQIRAAMKTIGGWERSESVQRDKAYGVGRFYKRL